eukprot:COSAG01_NODE_2433_length_7703_cov_64.622173_11_plen_47_part_00
MPDPEWPLTLSPECTRPCRACVEAKLASPLYDLEVQVTAAMPSAAM